MASLSRDAGGKKRIVFTDADGKRRTIWLGKLPVRAAEAIKVKVECLVASKMSGCGLGRETAHWVAELPQGLAEKLMRVELISPRETTTLGDFLDKYIASRTDLKPNTLKNYKQTQRSMIGYFGQERRLRDITPGDTDAWQVHLRNRVALATAGRRVKRAKQFFNVAIRKGIIPENPLEDFTAPAQVNPERLHYVTLADTQLLLDACRTPLQRLMIALARFAGLRIPSELVGLRWSEVNWDRERFVVHAPKNERYGKGRRIVPIFGSLTRPFHEAWEAAPEGEDRIFPDITLTSNKRTWLGKLAILAGIELWEKPWVNMRAAAVTDGADRHPNHVCEAWFGHSDAIANKHYRQVTEAHFQAASKGGGKESSTASPIASQYPSELPCNESHKKRKNPVIAEQYEALHNHTKATVPPRGVEPLSSD